MAKAKTTPKNATPKTESDDSSPKYATYKCVQCGATEKAGREPRTCSSCGQNEWKKA